jgi:hypothetical protein
VPAEEQCYTVAEIATLWNLDPDTVRPLFRNRPGVLKLKRLSTTRKRGYVSLRIPASVAAQVREELSR